MLSHRVWPAFAPSPACLRLEVWHAYASRARERIPSARVWLAFATSLACLSGLPSHRVALACQACLRFESGLPSHRVWLAFSRLACVCVFFWRVCHPTKCQVSALQSRLACATSAVMIIMKPLSVPSPRVWPASSLACLRFESGLPSRLACLRVWPASSLACVRSPCHCTRQVLDPGPLVQERDDG